MAARSYVSGCNLTADQLAAVNARGVATDDITDSGCTAAGLNTCGRWPLLPDIPSSLLTEDGKYYLITESGIPLKA